jgi:uncharacterized protein (TIGR02246 family)
MNKAKQAEDIPKLFVQNWNNRRADLLAELFEEDADFVNVVGLWWSSRSDIFKAHDYGLKTIFNNSTLKIGKLKTKMLTDSLAVVHARFQLSGQSPIGDYAGTRNNIFTFVVRKKADHWLCLAAHNTDIVVGAETYVRTESGGLTPADYRQKKPDTGNH